MIVNFLKKKINKGLILSMLTVSFPIVFQLFYIRFISYEVDKALYGKFVLLQTLIAALSAIFLTVPSSAFARYFNETSNKQRFVNEFRTLLIPVNVIGVIAIALYGVFYGKFSFVAMLFVALIYVFSNLISIDRQAILQRIERKKYFCIKS